MDEQPIKLEENWRNPDGTLKPGHPDLGGGRPKGKTIKERVMDWLEENPDDMRAFVEHFVKENKELAWQMLEGRPQQKTDIQSGGKPIPILNVLFHHNGDKENIGDDEKDSSGAGGDIGE